MSKRVEDGLTPEARAWRTLFRAIIGHNDYYDGIRRWARKNKIPRKELVNRLGDKYDGSEMAPYAFLDMVEDVIDSLDDEEEAKLTDVDKLMDFVWENA